MARVSVLGEDIHVGANIRQVFTKHQPYVLLLLLTIALDVLSTIAFMSAVGIESEHNAIVRHASFALGHVLGPPVGKLFQLFAVVALVGLTPRLAKFILSIVILMNLLAFIINMRVFLLGGA